MSDPFVHVRVASGYSLRNGASAPAALVAAAAGHGMDTLAITDRDGLYGAIRFAKACAAAGIAPVAGAPRGWRRAPGMYPKRLMLAEARWLVPLDLAGPAEVGDVVATQTPPVRSGRRVVFLTLEDTTGPADATFLEDVQGPYAATMFNSWQPVVRGELRRAGPRGVSVRAIGCWELGHQHALYTQALLETGSETEALDRVRAAMDVVPDGFGVGDADGRRRMPVAAAR